MNTTAVLSGKTAFITGGSGGIGGACAEALVRDGAAAMQKRRRRDAHEAKREAILEKYPAATIAIHAGDGMKTEDVVKGLDAAFALQGRLDIVIPTVGGGGIRPLLMHDIDTWKPTSLSTSRAPSLRCATPHRCSPARAGAASSAFHRIRRSSFSPGSRRIRQQRRDSKPSFVRRRKNSRDTKSE